MGLSASQARFLQLTARRSDVEYEVQQINFQRLQLSEKLSAASSKYQDAIDNRKLTFSYNNGQGIQEVDLSYNNYKAYMNQQLEGLTISQEPYYLVSSSGNKLVVQSEEERNKMIEENTRRDPVSSIIAAKAKVEAYETYLAQQKTGQKNPEVSETSNNTETSTTPETSQSENTQNTVPETPSPEDYRLSKIDITNYDPTDVCVTQDYTESDFLIVEDLNNTTIFQNALKEGIYYFATREQDKKTGEYHFNIKGLDTLGAGAISEVFDKSDDAAAQAEYETIQSKVQSLDKKLELKLDQLETERNAITTEMESVKKVIEDNVEQSFNIFS